MKQKALQGYRPNYPKKLLRGTALAAAALVAIGGAGCGARTDNAATSVPTEVPATEAPEELVLDGEIGIEEIPPENLVEPGEPTVDEPDDLILDGEVAVDAYPDEYDDTLLGGEPMPDDSYEEEDPEGEREEPALMGKIAVFDEPEEP